MAKDRFAALDEISVLPTQPRAAAPGEGGGLFEDTTGASARARLLEIPLAQIEPDPDQPRRDPGELSELIASIEQVGLLQPIVVTTVAPRRYRILAGERRFRAVQALGRAGILALVRSVEEHEWLLLQIVENLHRKDLSPFEEADSYRRLMEEFRLTQEQVAQRVGKSRVAVNQALRILDLPEALREECQTSDIASKSLLLEIAKQESGAAQRALWEQAKRGELTVQKARSQKKGSAPKGRAAPAAEPLPAAAPRAMTFRYPIETQEATVTVAFDRPSATLDEIIAALEEALAGEKARRG